MSASVGVNPPHSQPLACLEQDCAPEAMAAAMMAAWQARVSGQPTKILRANHGFQAVIVPAGEHRVELRYVDRTFLTGVALSSITVVVLLILGWRCRKIRTAATSGPPPAG